MSQQLTVFINNLEKPFNELAGKNSQVTFAQEAQFALQLLQANSFLLSTAQKSQDTLKNAIVNIAAVGLSLNPVSKDAYLVPRDGRICLDVSYRGLCKLAERAGSIRFVQAKVVRASDTFEISGPTAPPIHSYSPFKDRGEVIGVYCAALLQTGETLTEVMTIKECFYIRDRTKIWQKSKKGPWKDFEEQMMLKTVIKRAAKLWPTVGAVNHIHKAIDVINEHEGIDFEAEKIEAQEKENAEVKEAIKKQKEDAHKLSQDKKDIIDEIARIAGEKCEGKTLEEKGQYIRTVMKVNSFKDLDSKSLDELNVILNAVDWQEN